MSIIRVKHSDNFVTLSKQVLNDPNLSLKAIGLWARCMGRPDNWCFHISELAKNGKDKKASIYSAIKELIKNGYVIRGQRLISNDGRKSGGKRKLFNQVEYIFFEHKISPEEKEKYEADFQKLFPLTDFQHAENEHAENQPLINNKSISSSSYIPISKDKSESSAQPPVHSAEASGLANFLFEKIREFKKDFKQPKLDKWTKEIDRLIRVDKRDPDRIRQVIEFSTKHNFWQRNILSAEKLRLQFDKLEIEMGKTQEDSQVQQNKKIAFQLKEQYPTQLKSMKITSEYVMNPGTGKEVSLRMNPKSFRSTLIHIFGGSET